MRFRKAFVLEVGRALIRLGLENCPICKSGELGAHRYPVIALVGGLPPKASEKIDPEANIDYMVRVECTTCGHIMFFNAEQFRRSDEKILVAGLSEEEEAAIEESDPL